MLTVYANDGSGTLDVHDHQRVRVAGRQHEHPDLHRSGRRNERRHGHPRRPGRLERAIDGRRCSRLHHRRARARSRLPRRPSPSPRSRSRAGRPPPSRTARRPAAAPAQRATATTGTQTWQAQERSTAAGVLGNLGASPSIVINAANGTGTATVLPANAGNGSTGNTLTFTYTAAAGGIVNGAVTVTAPAGWSAPSTTPGTPGYATASTGTVSAAGQTITVSGVTLTARRDDDDRLRQYGRRRLRRDRGDERGRECIPDAGAVDRRRRAREHRGVAAGERLRGRRLGDDDHADGERRQRLVEHDRLHRTKRPPAASRTERSRSPRPPAGLRRRGEHDVVARRAQLRRPDGHRLGPDARSERHLHDHLRAGSGTDDRRAADVVDVGALDDRRNARRPRGIAVDQHLCTGRLRHAVRAHRRPSATARPATRRPSPTRRRPAARSTPR